MISPDEVKEREATELPEAHAQGESGTAAAAAEVVVEELYGALSHLLWRLSDDDHALRPYLGDEAVIRVRVHLEGAIKDGKRALSLARRAFPSVCGEGAAT